jgi:hypothetical protein
MTVRLHLLPRNHPGNLKVKIQRDPKSDPGKFPSRILLHCSAYRTHSQGQNKEPRIGEREGGGEQKATITLHSLIWSSTNILTISVDRKDTAGTGSAPVPDPPIRRSSRTAVPKPETSAKSASKSRQSSNQTKKQGWK